MKRFGMGILGGLAVVFGGLASALGGLAVFAPERLPAPAVTRLVPLDEKLRFLRQHPDLDPTILAVGSSIAWRQLAGEAIERASGGRERFLNGATGYLQIHQTHALTRFYLDHYRHVETILFVTGLPDFRNCSTEPRNMLDANAAARYAFDGWPSIYFYFSHFSPQRYLRSALTLPEEKTPFRGGLYLDRYGSGPLQVPEKMKPGLRYDAIAADPACRDAFRQFVGDVTRRHLRMTVVLPPVHPLYRRQHPEAAQEIARLAEFARETASIGKNVTVLALYDDPAFKAGDFFDAFHLQWQAARRLSKRIAPAVSQVPTPDRHHQPAPDPGDTPKDRTDPKVASDRAS